MKRLFDRLLSRWYVPRRDETRRIQGAIDRSIRTNGIAIVYNNDLPRSIIKDNVVVTTDYRRGMPCS